MRGGKFHRIRETLSLTLIAAAFVGGTQLMLSEAPEANVADHGSSSKSVHGDRIFPKNSLRRPVGHKQTGGVSRTQVDLILTRIKNVYGPEFKTRGLSLRTVNDWLSPEVNAYAKPDDNDFDIRIVVLQGGLSRYETINEDGLALVACHEIGHHIGGKPGYGRLQLDMAGEGQADYFASAKCFRQLFTGEENEDWYKQNKITSTIESMCTKAHATKEAGLACMRASTAGEILAVTLRQMRIEAAELRGITLNIPFLSVDTPASPTNWTEELDYPNHQCRLDTYFQGALCDIEGTISMSARSVQTGACTIAKKYTLGVRPNCWFKESDYPRDK